ncbi:MAG: SPASM domain-containing protein [Deltaproteobacteria bacterium]|nr:SPASM domain-containing protein [Deltaproteobacteria bacterium]
MIINYLTNNKKTETETDREDIINMLRALGPCQDVYYRLLIHYAVRYADYPPIAIGNFKIFSTNDPRSSMQAVHQILEAVYPEVSDRLDFLRGFRDYFPEGQTNDGTNPRVCSLLLAYYLFMNKEYEASLQHIQDALKIHSGCILSSHMYGEIMRLRGDPRELSLTGKFCTDPFDSVLISNDGSVHLCCPSNMPIIVGNVYQQTFEEIWNSDIAQEIRHSIHDGSFRYCNRIFCSKLYDKILPKETLIMDSKFELIIEQRKIKLDPNCLELACTGHDWTCNLKCASCRKDFYEPTEEQSRKLETATERVIIPIMKYAKTFHISGGEPFASKYSRDILMRLNAQDFPHLHTLGINTNGVLLTERQWEQIKNIEYLNIEVSVSVDAATEKTYNIVRSGGNWRQLNDNLRFLSRLRHEKIIGVLKVNFVVQDHNFREIHAFVELGLSLGCDQIRFIKIFNAGTFTEEEFNQRSVFDSKHPNFQELLTCLQDPILVKNKEQIAFIAFEDLFLKAGLEIQPAESQNSLPLFI